MPQEELNAFFTAGWTIILVGYFSMFTLGRLLKWDPVKEELRTISILLVGIACLICSR